jgi:hypothetical protein
LRSGLLLPSGDGAWDKPKDTVEDRAEFGDSEFADHSTHISASAISRE